MEEDMDQIAMALLDETIVEYGMIVEWLGTYVQYRVHGYKPEEAAVAAYYEWDL